MFSCILIPNTEARVLGERLIDQLTLEKLTGTCDVRAWKLTVCQSTTYLCSYVVIMQKRDSLTIRDSHSYTSYSKSFFSLLAMKSSLKSFFFFFSAASGFSLGWVANLSPDNTGQDRLFNSPVSNWEGREGRRTWLFRGFLITSKRGLFLSEW